MEKATSKVISKLLSRSNVFLITFLLFLFLFSPVFAWTEPLQLPPEGNLPPPLNQGVKNAPSFQYTWDKIGIGTDEPVNNLHVYGNTEQSIRIQATADSAVLYLQAGDPDASSPSQIYQAMDQDDLRFWVSGGDKMIINKDGKVGIGDTTPDAMLDVVSSGAGNAPLRLEHAASPTADYLQIASSGATGGNILTIDATGQVGIGTTSPSTALEVNGAVTATTFYGNATTADYATTAGSADHATYANSALRAQYLGDSFQVMADAQGNVGIGTTEPGAKLDVTGDANVSGTLSAGAISGSYTGTINASNVTPGYFASNDTPGNYTFTNADKVTPILHIDATNNRVGIGTTLPKSKLHVVGEDIRLEDNGSNPAIYIGDDVSTADAYGRLSWDSTGNYLYSGVGGDKSLVILSNGNVGIGTTEPEGKLGISGGGIAIINNDVDGKIYIADPSAGSTASYFVMGLKASDKTFRINRGASLGTNDDFVLQYTTGNVGIGTTSPGAKLDVNGAIILEGGNQGFAITEVDETDDPTGYTAGLGYGGIAINGNSGTNRQMFMFTDAAGANNTFSVVASTDEGSTWNHNFVIQQNGNVGIGTPSPRAKLDVEGGDIWLDDPTFNNDKHVVNVGYVEAMVGGAEGVSQGTQAGQTLRWSGSGWVASSNLYNDNTNVGIGTTSPGVKLHVKTVANAGSITAGTANAAIRIEDPSTSVAPRRGIAWQHAQTDATLAAIEPYVVSGWDTHLDFYNRQGGSLTHIMRLAETGNVGIGTTNPSDTLYVKGNVTITGLGNCSASNAVVRTDSSSRLVCGSITGAGGVAGAGNGQANYIPKWTDANTIAKTATPIFEKDGDKIGIGTTSPIANLNVKGTLTTALAGTVAVTNNSTAVIGTSTSFTSELSEGDAIKIKEEVFTVSEIPDATHLTLDSVYQGATESGLTAYKDSNLFYVQNGDAVSELIVDKSGIVNLTQNAEVGKILTVGNEVHTGAGSASFPAHSFSVDTNSGLYRLGEDKIGLITGGSATKGITIDSAGNVGIGTTGPGEKLHVEGGRVVFRDGTGNDNRILFDPIVDVSSLSPGSTTLASVIEGPYARHLIFDLTSNDAQDSIAFRTDSNIDGTVDAIAMVIKSSGNVGIGTTGPKGKLDVVRSNSGMQETLSTNPTLNVIGNAISSRTDSSVQELLRLHQPNTYDLSKGSTFSIGLSYWQDAGNNYPRTRTDFMTTGRTTDSSNVAQTVMSLRDDGNVGIGTTDPGSYKLNVNGTFKAAAADGGKIELNSNGDVIITL